MDPLDQRARVKALFEQAVSVQREDRTAWIAAQAGVDAAVVAELTSLLDAHDHPHRLFDRSVLNLGGIGGPAPDDAELVPVGSSIGPYRIEGHLGSGGMGAVYRAARSDGEFTQQVAIKVVHRGMNTAEIVRRFATERQVLATLTHPNIAMLFDAGTAANGQPYFVMEYVGGLPIDEYCHARALPPRPRLELFLSVCAGVAHAHQRLVVHRDLKPDNILVRDDGAVKLLDFGIAKVLDPEAADHTVTSLRPMTVRYASPEQVRGQPLTTATDVYSLGVLLYRLLTGRLPYALPDTSGPGIERAICEIDPDRPSEAARADTRARQWAPLLRGDLDAIVLMALRKEADRRYHSVDQFADDVRRYLRGAPVLARPDTWRYRARKFVGRNRAASVAAVIAAVALVAGLAGTSWAARQARRAAAVATEERQKAETEAVRVQRMNEFLTDVLALPDSSWYSPGAGGRADMTVIDLLRKAGERIDSEFAAYPDIAADLHHTLSNTLRARNHCEDSRRHSERALELRRGVFGERHAKVAESLYFLGAAVSCLADPAGALVLFQQSLAVERQLPEATGNLPYLLLDIGGLRQFFEEFDAAERAIREALAIMEQDFGPDDPRIAFPRNALASLFIRQSDYARALPELQAVLQASVRPRPAGAVSIEIGSRTELERVVALAQTSLDPNPCTAGQARVVLSQRMHELGQRTQTELILRRGLDEVAAGCGRASPEFRQAWASVDLSLGGALSRRR